MEYEAGKLGRPDGQGLYRPGLPYGALARQLIAWIQTESKRTSDPRVRIAAGISAFTRALGLHVKGQTTRRIREQMRRISTLSLVMYDGIATLNERLVRRALRFAEPGEQDATEEDIWPGVVELSADFVNSLDSHALPMRVEAYRALGHSALALDLYAFLTSRLHRIEPGTTTTVAWPVLWAQLGGGAPSAAHRPPTQRISEWRRNVMGRSGRPGALKQVLMVYPAADRAGAVQPTDEGLVLGYAEPPVPLKASAEARRWAAAGGQLELVYDPAKTRGRRSSSR